MPGMLHHLVFAEEVYRKLKDILLLDEINFMAGNLIPDFAKADKQKTHYRMKASNGVLWVPNLKLVKKDLYIPEDSIKFGMYSHLYLDYYFFENFLIPSFIWNKEEQKVISKKNNNQWDTNEFFSRKVLYKGYSEINFCIIKEKCITLEKIQEIPEILPNTGLPIFDERISTTWKQELKYYLEKNVNYTGEIFDYSKFLSFIQETAKQLAEEIKKNI